MKKRLLFLTVALMGWVGMSAADYVYTTNARYKLTGENLVVNGNFTEKNLGDAETFGWSQDGTVDAPLSSDAWIVEDGVGANGENVLTSKGVATASTLCQIIPAALDKGTTYVIAFDIKANAAFTSVIEAGKANSIDVYANGTGIADKTGAIQIASAVKVDTAWTSVAFALVSDTVLANGLIVVKMEQLPENTQITNIRVCEAEEVYDLRIAEKAVDWAKKMLAVEDFTEGKDGLERVLKTVNNAMGNEERSEDFNTMVNLIDTRLAEALENYLDANTENITKNTYFNYIEDLTKFPKYNRGTISNAQQIGGFLFRGDNWLHGDGADFLNKQIQSTSFQVGPGSVALYNDKMPAGKYFVAAEMMNGYINNSYAFYGNLAAAVKGFVGTDSVAIDTISGEEFVKYYFIAELKEGEKLEAGFWWDGPLTGASWRLKNFEIRSFSPVAEYVAHLEAFKAYSDQWLHAVADRNVLIGMMNEPNYPWGQDSLKVALDQWNPIFLDHYSKHWMNPDSTDAGIATTEQLKDWTTYQGVDTASVESRYKKFGLVRGFQDAATKVRNMNSPYTNLANAIDAAKSTRNKGTNGTGDRETFKAAIEKATETINTVRNNTSDATYDADTLTLINALRELLAAQESFLASVSGEVSLVNIDFSNNFELVEEKDSTDQVVNSYYVIKGKGGEMMFANKPVLADSIKPADYAASNNPYYLGSGATAGVLRVGKGNATVELPELQDSSVVLRIQFDLYVGNLIKRYVGIELRNDSNNCVAGFSYSKYDANVSFNDFNDVIGTANGGTGMDIRQYVLGLGSSTVYDNAIYANGAKNHFDLYIDYGTKTLRGTLTNGNGVVNEGKPQSFRSDRVDQKVTKFVLTSNYDNDARRCWFDNLKVSKIVTAGGDFEEDITTSPWATWLTDEQKAEQIANGIDELKAKMMKNMIFSITGQRLQSIPQKGLYIMNGKKYVVK